jgi:hypothetical protein
MHEQIARLRQMLDGDRRPASGNEVASQDVSASDSEKGIHSSP